MSTLWAPSVSGGFFDSNPGGPALSVGNQFAVSQSVPLVGIWWWSPTGSTVLPSACAIYNLDNGLQVSGTLNASPSWSGAVASGWVKCTYDGSISLSPGIHYAVVVFASSGSPSAGWFGATDQYWTSGAGSGGLMSGILSAPASANSVYGQSVYAYGSSIALPTSTVDGYNFWVDVEVALLSVSTISLPGATTGMAYNQTLAVTGGRSPYTWSVISGALPTGLSLSSSGVISGTPTATVGTSSFTVQVVDANSNIATASLSIAVSSLSFNTGATSDSGGSQAGSVGITVPSGVLGGDVMLLMVTGITPIATESTLILTSTGTSFTQISSTQFATMNGYSVDGALYSAVAAGSTGSTSTDVGVVVTASCSDNPYWAMALSAYTGASGAIDVYGGTAVTGTVGVTCPVETTGHDGEWAVYLGGGAVEGGAVPNGPSGSTLRERSGGAGAVYATIVDSNGSVGSQGTAIGGGAFTSSLGVTNNWWAAFTVGLAPANATVSITTSSLANVPVGVPILRFVSASGGIAPYSWSVLSGSLPPGLALTASGSLAGTLSGTATTAGSYVFTLGVMDSTANTADISLSITVVNVPLSPTSPTTDSNGVITWRVTSAINLNDSESIRVLKPTAPRGGYSHGFLLTLPVAGGTDDTSYGNGLDTIRLLGLHNTYNLTVVEPNTGGDWLADNPTSSQLIQESYILQVAAWAKATYGVGNDKIYLIGFSRTGIGGQGMFFHHPDIFHGVASWDFPAMMTAYNGTDVNGTVGGNSAGSYGTQDNFVNNYELSPANLARWSAGQNFAAVNRIWIGGYASFHGDVSSYAPVLTAADILHTVSLVQESSHNWAPSPGWVTPALAALLGAPQPGLMLTVFI
jgi:hypothetical protein